MTANLVGVLSFVGYLINTLFWVIPIVLLSIIKLLPIKIWQKWVSYPLDACATYWISCNTLNQRLVGNTKLRVKGLEELAKKDWYMVIANHQSWVDILVMQRIFNRKIPFLKFFLKQELIWVPVLGIAWWALDFPFMRRYSKSFLAKHPHMKGKDMETTRKACAKFKQKPVSVMNFVEGTRITEAKLKQQSSPYKYLLKPKAGGIAFVLSTMGEQLNKIVDVTIYYPDGRPTFWEYICGTVKRIEIRISTHSVQDLYDRGIFNQNYFDNTEQRVKFQTWLNQIWLKKDQELQLISKNK